MKISSFDKICFAATVLFISGVSGYFLTVEEGESPYILSQGVVETSLLEEVTETEKDSSEDFLDDFSEETLEETLEETSEEISEESLEETSEESSEETAEESLEETPSEEEGKIDINSATVEEFMTLSGIGQQRGEDLVAYREAIGGFTKLEQIMDVSGIGTATFEKIQEFLFLGSYDTERDRNE